MIAWIKAKSAALWAWCKHSHTIMFARLQVLAGSVWAVLTTGDLAPLLEPRWLTVWLIVSGTITEFARRAPGKSDL